MEILKMLAISSPSMERGSGFPEIVPTDVAAALGKLGRPVSLYARVVYLGEEGKRDELVKHLIPECIKLGYDRDGVMLEGLILLGLEESKKQNRCTGCKGVGTIGIHKCETCYGSGLKRPSDRSRGKFLYMDRRKFKRRWKRLYEQTVLPTLTELDIQLSWLKHKLG